MAIQTKYGKAFEYACLNTLSTQLNNQAITIDQNQAYINAQTFYNSVPSAIRYDMDSAANAAIRIIIRMEPNLNNPLQNTPLHLSIQEDSAGIGGDVRDLIMIRTQNNWEIGISCKHNHSAVKHSRLSDVNDFGNSWFSIPCTQNYFSALQPIFNRLRQMQQNSIRWNAVPNKQAQIYVPVLNEFIAEVRRLDLANPGIIPDRLMRYLLGSNDFYKVITNDRQRTTRIQAFNINRTLNKRAGNIRPQIPLTQLVMPTRIHHIGFKNNSTTTIEIHCDAGWGVELRIHSASSKVEPSLKFDVKLIGQPTGLFSHDEPW